MEREVDKKLILIVDDEPRIGKILSRRLALSGYRVLSITSGSEALESVRSQDPDIILLDIVMPDMDGFQVLQKLRSFSNLPVIAFSASTENGPKAIKLGANDFIAKPFDVEELEARLTGILNDGV